MRIEAEGLSAAERPFTHTYTADELELDDERAHLKGETQISGRARREGERVRVRGNLRTIIEAPCDRCLRETVAPVETEFDVTYVSALAPAPEDEVGIPSDEMDVSTFDGEAIDVDDLAREQILLALPARLLCREDCKGLCPTCGADMNTEACSCREKEVDPRWAALAALKKEDG